MANPTLKCVKMYAGVLKMYKQGGTRKLKVHIPHLSVF